jgi:hypothetical protein
LVQNVTNKGLSDLKKTKALTTPKLTMTDAADTEPLSSEEYHPIFTVNLMKISIGTDLSDSII